MKWIDIGHRPFVRCVIINEINITSLHKSPLDYNRWERLNAIRCVHFMEFGFWELNIFCDEPVGAVHHI